MCWTHTEFLFEKRTPKMVVSSNYICSWQFSGQTAHFLFKKGPIANWNASRVSGESIDAFRWHRNRWKRSINMRCDLLYSTFLEVCLSNILFCVQYWEIVSFVGSLALTFGRARAHTHNMCVFMASNRQTNKKQMFHAWINANI